MRNKNIQFRSWLALDVRKMGGNIWEHVFAKIKENVWPTQLTHWIWNGGERRTLVSRWFSLRIWGWKEGEGNQSSGSGIFLNKEKGQKYFLKNGNEWQRFQQVDTRFSHHHLEFQFITHTFTPTFSFFSSFFSPFFFLTTFPRSGEVMIQPLFRFRRRQGGGFFCVERHTKITKEMRQERERKVLPPPKQIDV